MLALESKKNAVPLRIALVAPHMFMHRDILPRVIFAPGMLVVELANHLANMGADVTLYTPGPVDTKAKNISTNLSGFDKELSLRGDSYLDLLKKHPLTFITMARQVQSNIVAAAYSAANESKHDIVHVYMNEEEIALQFAQFCNKPVIFTHHDPFNYLAKYRNTYPRYKHLNWISISLSQRLNMPRDTHWIDNIYNAAPHTSLRPVIKPSLNYFAYLGRIIEPKGVHLAIQAVQRYNKKHHVNVMLKIAGKHYSTASKDHYWNKRILPNIDGTEIEFVGYIGNTKQKRQFLANAKALIVPSIFDEPFGLVTVEALACGTPVIGLNKGATSEIITNKKTGYISNVYYSKNHSGKQIVNDKATATGLVKSLEKIDGINRDTCRLEFERCFTIKNMATNHLNTYMRLYNNK